MKHFILTLLAVLIASGAFAQPKAYFCTDKGMTLRYERYDSNNGKHWWTQTTRIDDVRGREDGSYEIVFTSNVKSDKVKSPVKGDLTSKAIIHSNGTVDINISEAVALAAKNMFSAFNFRARGGISSLKAAARPGEIIADIHGAVDWKGIKYTLDYTERSVLRRETVTVPAGTFDCIVVKEHKVENSPLRKRDRITLTWYALGYGMIKHDSFFLDGKQECSEQLYSITR